MKAIMFTSVLLLVLIKTAVSQSFVNLDFENARFTADPTSGYYPYAVYASNSIPGWTAYETTLPSSEIFSNSESISGGAVSIIGTNYFRPLIQGKYSILLEGFNYPGSLNSAGIGQTGTVPLTAQSLIFWGNVVANDVSFGGQNLALTVMGSTANYNIYEADISAYAGQTGQLLFSTIPGGQDMIDNIQFSTSPVPEPSTLGLLALSGALLGLRNRRRLS